MDDFDEYIRQVEPGKRAKGAIWETAIGLQQVDGLEPSGYLIENAKQNIEGDITIDEVKRRLDSYYEQQAPKAPDDDRTEEADKVSARIAEILSEQTFSFTPAEYINIHGRLFADIYSHAGKIRDYNITKKEWVLDGETVLYAGADSIKSALEYDFSQERDFDYKDLSNQEKVEHIAQFISNVWQIHPFAEGNTRTTAVFAMKYLRAFGFSIDNEPFARDSWYFRNALVRANYNNLARKVYSTNKYLDMFFANLLFGESYQLSNRKLHIRYSEKLGVNEDTPNMLGVKEGEKLGVKLSKNQLGIVASITGDPQITIKEMAAQLDISDTTIENNLKKLRDTGVVERVGSDKTGRWIVCIDNNENATNSSGGEKQ